MLDEVSLIIFTTALDEYAIKSFVYSAFDYLLKSINQKRLSKSLEKVIEKFSKKRSLRDNKDDNLSLDKQIFIKDGEKY